MVERLKIIACLYALPVAIAVAVQFMDGLQINGEDASHLAKAVFGLAFGMAAEGFVFIFFGTIAVITGRFD